MPGHAEALVEIGAHDLLQILHAILEEVVGVGDHRMLDENALLGLELLDERLNLLERRDAILVAVDEQARRRARREKREIEAVGRGRDGDEALDLGTAHQQLHADPGAERDAGDPAGARFRVDALRPVKRAGGVRQFPLPVVEGALRATDAAKVEAQHGEAAFGEAVVGRIDDLVVHRAPELGVGMQDDGDRGAALLGRVEPAFEASGGTVEKHFGHRGSKLCARARAGFTFSDWPLAARERRA